MPLENGNAAIAVGDVERHPRAGSAGAGQLSERPEAFRLAQDEAVLDSRDVRSFGDADRCLFRSDQDGGPRSGTAA